MQRYLSLVHPLYNHGTPVRGAPAYVVNDQRVYQGVVVAHGGQHAAEYRTPTNALAYAWRWFGDPAEARLALLDELRDALSRHRASVSQIERRIEEVEADHA